MHERRLDLPLALALFGSLVFHALGLSAAHRVAEQRQNVVTALNPVAPADEGDRFREQENRDELEINPGIDNGAMSTLTWIGYEEYEEHLAQLAEADQAAFTREEAHGLPTAREDVERSVESAEAPNQPTEQKMADANAAVESADAEPVVAPVTPDERAGAEPTEEALADVEHSETGAPVTVGTESAEVESEAATPYEESPAAPAATEGEPTSPEAEKTDKDSAATSTEKVPEIDWDHGRPMAIEGVEIHPYSLYRHIVVDSEDLRFAMNWTNRVARNPIVELSFDRTGRVPRLEVLRESGHRALDKQYLSSWLSRWTASGEKLRELKPDQVTKPIMIRLVFIEEPEKKEKEGGG